MESPNGNITNTAKSTNISNPLNVNDNVTVSKSVNATEDVIGGGISLKSHLHGNGNMGADTTPPK